MTKAFRETLMEMGLGAIEAVVAGMPRQYAIEAVARAALDYGEPEALARLGPSFALAWAECGFATVEVGHRLAASLIATSIPREHVAELVRMPWRCFGFHVPPGLISDQVSFALVLHARNGSYNMLSNQHNMIHCGVENSLEDWNLKFGESETEDNAFGHRVPEGLTRETELLGRLFLGICAEMSIHRPTAVPSQHKLKTRSRKQPDRVAPHTFKLTRDVKVDVRSAVRDYAEGRVMKSPTVQVLVRGHWKSQVCGTGLMERKMIHVEPYWRGPEDGPAAVRVFHVGS